MSVTCDTLSVNLKILPALFMIHMTTVIPATPAATAFSLLVSTSDD